jgi:hypothetical protein
VGDALGVPVEFMSNDGIGVFAHRRSAGGLEKHRTAGFRVEMWAIVCFWRICAF